MFIDFLLSVFEKNRDSDALVWNDKAYSYSWLLQGYEKALSSLREKGIAENSVVAVQADFSPMAVATLLALVEQGCILVPLTSSVAAKMREFQETAQVEWAIQIDPQDRLIFERLPNSPTHDLLLGLRKRKRPGLVLFSSGSTGKAKAALHDLVPLLEKFKVGRHAKRMITFLLFDHIGGVNTLFYVLSNGGCAITVGNRDPGKVCETIQRHRAQVLPTSPTFLNLLLLSEAIGRFDLSTLELVTYGTEVMPKSTLKRIRQALPHVRLLQTYGLSEVGILRSKSRSSDSLWVKVGGEGYETRVVDGMLEIKTQSAMLGYLNEVSPFTPDGWFQTGDSVDQDGDYFRFHGRKSELIFIGGEKVFPAEVESLLLELDGVEDATVIGMPHPITGSIVKALVKLNTGESLSDFRKRMRRYCSKKLPSFKIPQKVQLVTQSTSGERFKKIRPKES